MKVGTDGTGKPLTTDELKAALSKQLFGMTTESAIEQGICLECNELAAPKCYSERGAREYQITGYCELCFDKFN